MSEVVERVQDVIGNVLHHQNTGDIGVVDRVTLSLHQSSSLLASVLSGVSTVINDEVCKLLPSLR